MGEMACGKLRNRSEVLTLPGDLPRIMVATDAEGLLFIERHGLMGRVSTLSTPIFWRRYPWPARPGFGRGTNGWVRWPPSWDWHMKDDPRIR